MTDDATAHFVKYAVATGEILCTGFCQAIDLALQAEDDTLAVLAVERGDLPGIGHDTHYVQDGALAERPTLPFQLDGARLTGLPIPATITIEGKTYRSDDGEVEMIFDRPGTYTPLIESWPYQPKTVWVSVGGY